MTRLTVPAGVADDNGTVKPIDFYSMKRSIAIAGAVVVVCMLAIYSVAYLPYGIGYMRTMKKHCEEAKREIAAVEFTGKIVDVKDERLHIRLAEPLLFSKVCPSNIHTGMMTERAYCSCSQTSPCCIMPKPECA